ATVAVAESAPASGAQQAGSFAATRESALQSVNAQSQKSSALTEAYERGETVDIAKVMLARQEASVGFEATLQVRNKILSAYKDIMSMPV
ncbi:MAG: flagellar hook-basal body complex protein FliE, partial [Sphingomonas sp.]